MLQIADIPSLPMPVFEAAYTKRRFISLESLGSQMLAVDLDVGRYVFFLHLGHSEENRALCP